MRAERGTLEFDRLAFFSDAVFAIALTLLGAEIAPPIIQDTKDGEQLWSAIRDQQPEITMFFVSFAVIGFYWMSHHRFFRRLAVIDSAFIRASFVYLAFVAFLPIPSALLGRYTENPVGVAVYAVSVGLLSLLEVVLFLVAHRQDLFEQEMSDPARHWTLVLSLAPVVVFFLSVPIAFLLSPFIAMLCWLAIAPAEFLVQRFAPPAVIKEAEG